MANTNRYEGLARGPIDHKSSSVINLVSNGSIDMGSLVLCFTSLLSDETLPRVIEGNTLGSLLVYGIAVGGDADGIYGDGSTSTDDLTRATNAAGQGVVVVTQGRCLAKVNGAANGTVFIGDALSASSVDGQLHKAAAGADVIAYALNDVANTDTDMIAVDVKRTGIF